MKMIANRAAIIVRPRVPFIDWVRGADDESKDITTREIKDEPNVYLVHDFEVDAEKSQVIAENFKTIFEEELFGWNTDESAWPKNRDLKTFKQWFRVEFLTMVLDLSDEEYFIQE